MRQNPTLHSSSEHAAACKEASQANDRALFCRGSSLSGKWTYPELTRTMLGPWGAAFLDLSVIVRCFGEVGGCCFWQIIGPPPLAFAMCICCCEARGQAPQSYKLVSKGLHAQPGAAVDLRIQSLANALAASVIVSMNSLDLQSSLLVTHVINSKREYLPCPSASMLLEVACFSSS